MADKFDTPGGLLDPGVGSGFTGTEGSVPFCDAEGALTEDNANFVRTDAIGLSILQNEAPDFYVGVRAETDADGADAIAGVATGAGSPGLLCFGVVGNATGAACYGVAGQADGAQGIGVSGVSGHVDGGFGVLGESRAGYSIFARSSAVANAEPTLVSRRFSTSVADLIQAQAADGNPVFAVNATGGVFATLPTSNPGVAGQLWNDAGVVKVSAG